MGFSPFVFTLCFLVISFIIYLPIIWVGRKIEDLVLAFMIMWVGFFLSLYLGIFICGNLDVGITNADCHITQTYLEETKKTRDCSCASSEKNSKNQEEILEEVKDLLKSLNDNIRTIKEKDSLEVN